MAISPKEMEYAIAQNLKAKTGKTIEQWISIVHKSGIKDAKDQLNYLKSNFVLGHFQANVIIKASRGKQDEYADEQALVDLQFKGKNECLREIYDALVIKIQNFGKDLSIKPCKMYIPFYRKNQFLIVKTKNGKLYLGIPLSNYKYSGTQIPVKGLGMPEKIGIVIPVENLNDLNNEIYNLVKTAYDNNL